ncbi:MAG: hypothetical protein HQK51_00465 [Oligoflexia bacterium]|nr:hypothetical protein [Oligoflexia bacterium]
MKLLDQLLDKFKKNKNSTKGSEEKNTTQISVETTNNSDTGTDTGITNPAKLSIPNITSSIKNILHSDKQKNSNSPDITKEEAGEKKAKRTKIIKYVLMGAVIIVAGSILLEPNEDPQVKSTKNANGNIEASQDNKGKLRRKFKPKIVESNEMKKELKENKDSNENKENNEIKEIKENSTTTTATTENSNSISNSNSDNNVVPAPSSTNEIKTFAPEAPSTIVGQKDVKEVEIKETTNTKNSQTSSTAIDDTYAAPLISKDIDKLKNAVSKFSVEEKSIDTEKKDDENDKSDKSDKSDKNEETGPETNKEKNNQTQRIPSSKNLSLNPDSLTNENNAHALPIPNYNSKGRGLVYNCKGKHWACLNKEHYFQCKSNQIWSKQKNTSPTCVIFEVYASEEDCIETQKMKVNESGSASKLCDN